MSFLAACVQIQGSSDVDRNARTTEALIRRSAGRGAALVCTPEATDYLGPHKDKVRLAEAINGPLVQGWSALAKELKITLLIGSFAEATGTDRPANTSLLFGPDGQLLAYYRKVHLFDVDVPGGVQFLESTTTTPGDELVNVASEVGQIGLSICYDLRFPGLYQALAKRGAQLLTVPSAFTLMTGKDHWHALLRARAIENQCYVLAPGQWGHHDDGGLRESYGRSCIIDPWGQILAECPDGEGICMAEIDLEAQASLRQRMPVLEHRRY
ncbi:MAG: putative amidohydrolase [Cognaticolwellia sp.]|jgi:predicted amidohydrolase